MSDQFLPRPPAPQPVESMQAFDAAPKPEAPRRLGHWANELPVEVMDSAHWSGRDADRFFVVDEPELREVTAITAKDVDMTTKLPDFVRALGRPDPDGNIMRDEKGDPIYMPVDYITATAWFGRLGTKGKAGALYLWTETFNVTQQMGEAMRGSRRRLG
jgi:hypothetical protein